MMSETRRELAARKASMIEHEQGVKDAATFERLKARAKAQAESVRRVFVSPKGTYLSRAWVSRFLGLHASGLRMFPWVRIQNCPCLAAGLLEEELDSGAFGIGRIGKLEVLRALDYEKLDGEDRRVLGFAAREFGGIYKGSRGIYDWFELLRRESHVVGWTGCNIENMCRWPGGGVARFAWASVNGDPRKGLVSKLEDVFPREAGIARKGMSEVDLLWLRTLKRKPHPQAQADSVDEGAASTATAAE